MTSFPQDAISIIDDEDLIILDDDNDCVEDIDQSKPAKFFSIPS
jgi:hypothetical protein